MNISPTGFFSSPDFGISDLPMAKMPPRLDLGLSDVTPDFGPVSPPLRLDFGLSDQLPMPRSLDLHLPQLQFGAPELLKSLPLNNVGSTVANPSWGSNLLKAAVPVSLVVGETHAPFTPFAKIPNVRPLDGNFVLINHESPKDSVFFGARVFSRHPVDLPLGLGKGGVGFSGVGTVGLGPDNFGDIEVGPGTALKGTIPGTNVNFFGWLNSRVDDTALQNFRPGYPAAGDGTGSINAGLAVSASDLLFGGLEKTRWPAVQAAGKLGQLIADEAGFDLWAGLGARGSLTFKDGRPASLAFNNYKVDIDGLTPGQIAANVVDGITPGQAFRLGSQVFANTLFRDTPGSSSLNFSVPGSPGFVNNVPSLGSANFGNIIRGPDTYRLF